jgi:hypothetical protein
MTAFNMLLEYLSITSCGSAICDVMIKGGGNGEKLTRLDPAVDNSGFSGDTSYGNT